MKVASVQQYTARSAPLVPSLELIPPLADEFSVYGTKEVVELAREWALNWQYLLVHGVACCAHGFYGMGTCPGSCHSLAGFDHVNLWLPYSEPHQPFLLSAPYEQDKLRRSRTYANMHGLGADVYPWDGWYGSGTYPIRLTVRADVQAWPLSLMAAQVLMAWPVKWPDGDDE